MKYARVRKTGAEMIDFVRFCWYKTTILNRL